MSRLDYVAKALLVYETLDSEQFVKAFNKELPLELESTEETRNVDTTEEVTKLDKNHKENLNRNPLGLNREAVDDKKDE